MNADDIKAHILLVEDSASLTAVYQGYLATEPYRLEAVNNGAEALGRLDHELPDIVLLDLRLPDMSGMEVLRHIHDNVLGCTVIIITAHGSIDAAVEAMQYGATDFLAKPFDATRLRVTLTNALDQRRLSNLVTRYQQATERDRFHGFIGCSLPMQTVYRIIEAAAPSKATCFITGESGTGKELCAEAIHRESPRRDQPFVAINCAAIPRELMESEVFGHVKGAFTGAASHRDGAASRADGGTLFLDEIGEMNLDLQSKLLRFIQSGRFQRVGDNKEEQVDIRIVCATNRDPLAEVRAGRFREDLYYRLNVIPIPLPPLRERGDDELLIANDMLQRMATEEHKAFRGFAPEAAERILRYPWPGNVRELENVIRHIVVLNDAEQVSRDMLPAPLKTATSAQDTTPNSPPPKTTTLEPTTVDSDAIRPLWQEEKVIIERAIALCDGNIPRAAALLEISASTIYRKRLSWEKSPSR